MNPMMMNPMMMQMMMGNMKGMGKGKGKGKSKDTTGKMCLTHFPADKKVWVGDIPDGVTNRELHEHFKEVGAKWSESFGGSRKGTGGVAFKTSEEATNAIATLNGSTLNGSSIVVDVWTKK